jgi:hypothetical protein
MDKMVFHKYSGDYHLRLESADDLRNILKLKETHWVATSCPIDGQNGDPAFYDYLDYDANGRIRTDELRTALTWIFDVIKDTSGIDNGTDSLRLDAINTESNVGNAINAAASRILRNLGQKDAKAISLHQVRDQKSIMARATANGDGVIPPSAGKQPETQELIQAAMQYVGSVKDASGSDGCTIDNVETFLKRAEAFLKWQAEGKKASEQEENPRLPWGDDSAEAWNTIVAVRDKIDQFFALCDLERYDPAGAARARVEDEKEPPADMDDTASVDAYLRKTPIAPVNPEGLLKFDEILNPRYDEALEKLRDTVLKRALNSDDVTQINREEWLNILGIFAPYRQWLESKPETGGLEKMGSEKLRHLLDSHAVDEVRQLAEADRAVAAELKEVRSVEKAILYQQWMLPFVNSFVSFSSLYDPDTRALFEMGTLIIDGRELTFTVKVTDRNQHKNLAQNSNMFIIYAEISGRKGTDVAEEKFEIVAAVTSGDSVGFEKEKRGIFFTIDGREWDARIVDTVENPVSLREALKAPFVKVGGFLGKQAEKFSKTQEAKLEKVVASPGQSSVARDMLLAGSVGLAALGSSFAYITKALKEVSLLQVGTVLLGIGVLVFGPSLIIGWIRLKQRDLTILLEASGWATNIRMRVSGTLGRLFTIRPKLPPEAQKQRRDRATGFARTLGMHRVNWWRVLIVVMIGVAVLEGWMLYNFWPFLTR